MRTKRPDTVPAAARAALAALLAALGGAAGCASSRTLPVIPVVPFDGWDYVEGRTPNPGAGLSFAEQDGLLAAWKLVVEGRLGEADMGLAPLLVAAPDDPGTLDTAGFLALRAGRIEAADALFGRALEENPQDGLAALGRVLVVLDDEDIEAVFRRLRRLAEIEPGSPVVTDRLPATTLDVAEQRLRQAREIADRDAGDPAVADAYRAALEVVPDSADLLLEAAEAAAAAGRNRSAREWLDSVAAASSSASERQALTARIAAAELLADENRLAESLVRLDRILADPGLGSLPELASRAGALEHRLEVARLSEMYDRIREAERITREQFAALLSAELGAPPEGAGAPSSSRSGIVIAIDIERSWAANLIRTAVGAGYLHLFPDHTFKPRAFVSRAELAEALMSALGALGPDALESASREAAARQLTDLPEGHPSRAAALVAAHLDLIPVAESGAFRPRDFASGAEAVRAVHALRDLLGGPSG